MSLNASANLSSTAPPQAFPYEDLLESIAVRRDRDAFAQLFNSLAPKVKGFMMRKGLAPDRAEDIAVETFVKIWIRAGTFDPTHGSAVAWIFRISRNAHIDVMRRERHPDEFGPVEIASAQASPEDEYRNRERQERVRAALRELPPDQAQVCAFH